jgi:hypothetical protein
MAAKVGVGFCKKQFPSSQDDFQGWSWPRLIATAFSLRVDDLSLIRKSSNGCCPAAKASVLWLPKYQNTIFNTLHFHRSLRLVTI